MNNENNTNNNLSPQQQQQQLGTYPDVPQSTTPTTLSTTSLSPTTTPTTTSMIDTNTTTNTNIPTSNDTQTESNNIAKNSQNAFDAISSMIGQSLGSLPTTQHQHQHQNHHDDNFDPYDLHSNSSHSGSNSHKIWNFIDNHMGGLRKRGNAQPSSTLLNSNVVSYGTSTPSSPSDGGSQRKRHDNSNNEWDEDDEMEEEEEVDIVIEPRQNTKLTRLPNIGTNIDDIRKKVDFHQYGKRFLMVGLHYECHSFQTLKQMVQHVSNEVNPNREYDPQLTLTFNGALNLLPQHDPIWIDVQNPSIADMKMMERYFGLHPLTTEDIINSDTGEKWELFSEYMFVVFIGQVDDEYLPPSTTNKYLSHHDGSETQLNIIVFPNFVITIHDRPIKGLDMLMSRIESEFELQIEHGSLGTTIPLQYKYSRERLRYRHNMESSAALRQSSSDPNIHFPQHGETEQQIEMGSLPRHSLSYSQLQTESTASTVTNEEHPSSTATTATIEDNISVVTDRKQTQVPSSDWVLYAFLDAMVDIYIPFVDSLSLEVEDLDDLVFELHDSEKDELLKRLGMAKRNVVTLRRLLLPKQKMTTYLSGQTIRFISKPVQVYLRDVLDHLKICLDKLEVARENLNQTHNNYLTRVQIEIAAASGRTDAFMNRITVIASLLGPLTLISAIWGMNVKVPGQDVDNLYWFYGLNGFMIIFALVLIILLRKKLIGK